MREIERVRQEKVARLGQSVFFDIKGNVVESSECIFDIGCLQHKLATEWFPFMESVFPSLEDLKVDGVALHFSRVENPAPFLSGVYDFSFSKVKIEEEELILWELFDYTDLYEDFRNFQQRRNNLEIQRQRYILENKRKKRATLLKKKKEKNQGKTSFEKGEVTPLHALDMAVNNIQVIPDSDQESVIDSLDGISTVLQEIVNELPEKEIDYTECQSGKEREFSLENLLYDSIPYISADNINIVEASVTEELPNRLYGNSLDLKRVIVGLAINATKCYKECSLSLNLYLEDLRQDKCVVGLQILASGISQQPDMLETLLRLALVKRIVELHQGKVIMESLPEIGAKTTCHIPFLLS